MDASARRATHEFRPDIEGLRGVAVLMVVLFHADLVGLPGGFIGVDVFFVISGFLITGLLLRERERTGRIGLRAFYARRIRRLLPAGLVVLLVTLAAASVALAPLDRTEAMLDGAAAALSIGNVRFALAAGDYFTSVAAPSPFLHYWSLSVEEQFYLVWPAILLVATRAGRPRVGAAIVLVAIAVASMAVNAWLTDVAVSWAFYSLPSRAWQLALGGLLAVAGGALARIPREPLVVAGWFGLVALAGASLVFGGDLAYPGVPAILPTVAATALVASGTATGGPGLLLRLPPLRFLGKISYSLYLWHWPVLVACSATLAATPAVETRIAMVGIALLLATASWRWIEEPFRTGFPTMTQRQGRTVLAGGLAVVLVAATASGLAVAHSETGVGGLATAELGSQATGSATTDDDDTADPGDAGPGAVIVIDEGDGVDLADRTDVGGEGVILVDPGTDTDPSLEPDPSPPATSPPTPPSAAPASSPRPTQPVSWRLPRDVRPSLGAVRGDEERLRGDGCLAFEPAVQPPDCVYGQPNARFTLALVGDSHAAQWFPALNRIAASRGWRLVTFVKVACPFVDMPIYNLSLKREYRECEAWRSAVVRRLRDQRPDLTLVSSSRYAIHPIRREDASTDARASALARMLERIPGRVGVIVDTPDPGEDVPACLSRHPDDIRPCAIPKSTATSNQLGAIERRAARQVHAALIDLTRRVCPSWPCQVVGDGIIKFRDIRHLTATFARSMASGLDDALTLVLATSPDAAPAPTRSTTPCDVSRPDAGPVRLASPCGVLRRGVEPALP